MIDNIFEIESIVGVIRSAQRRADRLRTAQAVVVRCGELTVTTASHAQNPIEIVHPSRTRRADSLAAEVA